MEVDTTDHHVFLNLWRTRVPDTAGEQHSPAGTAWRAPLRPRRLQGPPRPSRPSCASLPLETGPEAGGGDSPETAGPGASRQRQPQPGGGRGRAGRGRGSRAQPLHSPAAPRALTGGCQSPAETPWRGGRRLPRPPAPRPGGPRGASRASGDPAPPSLAHSPSTSRATSDGSSMARGGEGNGGGAGNGGGGGRGGREGGEEAAGRSSRRRSAAAPPPRRRRGNSASQRRARPLPPEPAAAAAAHPLPGLPAAAAAAARGPRSAPRRWGRGGRAPQPRVAVLPGRLPPLRHAARR